jgi:4-amino-4-deoxy-L-arabinose transferase-like glycosyltransferase
MGTNLSEERGFLRSPVAMDAAVFALALAFRLSLYPSFRSIGLAFDESYYWRTAEKGFLEPQLRMPLWSGALALVRLVRDEPIAGRLLAVLLGSLSAALACRLARHLYGARAGLVAGAIAACHPELVMWSHYIWSEMLFGFLLLAACTRFFPPSPDEPPRVVAAGAWLGLAFLTKEFALVPFAAFCVALVAGRVRLPPGRLALGAVLFLLPLATYMAAFRVHNGKHFRPLGAAAGNLRQAVGLDANEEKSRETYRETVATYDLRGIAGKTRENLVRLWGSQSFPLWRLSARSAPSHLRIREIQDGSGDYGEVPARWVLLGFVAFHALVLLAGVVGLAASEHRTFKPFALSTVVFLSLAAVPALLVSRFRVPFLFLFVVETARLLADPRTVAARLFASRWRVLGAALTVAVFSWLLLGNLDALATWG